MTPDQRRLAGEAQSPRIVRLARALARTRSLVSFMNSGAHPDDETSAMLAALAWREGMHLSYVCSTRGEGGQNDIGTESGPVLGTLRTAEMERAARALDMTLHWLSPAPGVIHDFGFSKSGEETLRRWGYGETLAAFVRVVRRMRPDMLCPTFLDVSGQHGHHRAMTRLAHDAFEAAADPTFGEGEPWSVAKLLLPAWGGGGSAYDDAEPPPPETFRVSTSGADAVDPITGTSWEVLGQTSRAHHRTQGMGRWVPAGEERDWPLHLVESRVGGGGSLADGLPTLTDLDDPGGHLARVSTLVAEAGDAFPDIETVAPPAAAALRSLREAMAGHDEAHRLRRLERALERAFVIASGAQIHARAAHTFVRPGETAELNVDLREGRGPTATRVAVPDGWKGDTASLVAGPEPSDPYPAEYDPHAPPLPRVALSVEIDGVRAETRHAIENAPFVLPSVTATPMPDAAIVNRAAPRDGALTFTVQDVHPDGPVGLTAPDGWTVKTDGARIALDVPTGAPPALYELPVTVSGSPASAVTRIAHEHVAPRAYHAPAVLRVRVLDAALAGGRVGYAGAGRDRVADRLADMGADVTELTDKALGDPAALAPFDTIVVGIFAIGRPTLRAAMSRLHDWVRAGGNLVTLYHRPWDGWDPDTVPPLPLEIGQPSLRWRVTDEAAEVTHLAPDHPLLNAPNLIGPDDWAGWDKERGLYFAKSWDEAYVPLLSTRDPDEAPLTGSLLSAAVGEGRHTHASLILHHQMERLVPGAYRLMANLIAPCR